MQSSSMPLQTSVAPGWTALLPSLQSVLLAEYPTGALVSQRLAMAVEP